MTTKKSQPTKDNSQEEVSTFSFIVSLFEKELEIKKKEREIFTESMKEITGGKGFVLTNSK